MVRRVRLRFDCEIEFGDELVSTPGTHEALRESAGRVRRVVVAARDAVEAEPHVRLLSWSSSAAHSDGSH